MSGKHIFFILTAVCVMFSCQMVDNNGIKSEHISSLDIDTESNAMRVIVRVAFKKDCEWSVKYWETFSTVESSRMTATRSATTGEASEALLLFLKPETEYSFQIFVNGCPEGNVFPFRTIKKPSYLKNFSLVEKNVEDWVDGYILQTDGSESGYISLCDYDGKVVWYNSYGKHSEFSWYNPKNGLLSVYCGSTENGDESQYMICSDLAGNILYKFKSDGSSVPDVHHDLRMLDNGNLLALSKVPKVFDGATYWGDAVTEINRAGQKVFYWDTHEDFNPHLMPQIPNKPNQRDYLHANSVEKDSNGDYYMTLNWLTEIIKIDGKTGRLLYRFGVNGDVKLTGEVPPVYHSVMSPGEFLPENSAVHSAIALEPDRILCLANGKNDNVSKAVIVKIDPVKKEARYELIVDFKKRFHTADRSNVCILPGNRLLLGSAPGFNTVIIDFNGTTLRVLSRESISPRAVFYTPEQFNYYLDI